MCSINISKLNELGNNKNFITEVNKFYLDCNKNINNLYNSESKFTSFGLNTIDVIYLLCSFKYRLSDQYFNLETLKIKKNLISQIFREFGRPDDIIKYKRWSFKPTMNFLILQDIMNNDDKTTTIKDFCDHYRSNMNRMRHLLTHKESEKINGRIKTFILYNGQKADMDIVECRVKLNLPVNPTIGKMTAVQFIDHLFNNAAARLRMRELLKEQDKYVLPAEIGELYDYYETHVKDFIPMDIRKVFSDILHGLIDNNIKYNLQKNSNIRQILTNKIWDQEECPNPYKILYIRKQIYS